MNKQLIIILINILISFSLLGQRKWEPVGFGGAGNFLSVHFDPDTPGLVYACSDVTGIFRSTDYGETWEVRGKGLQNYEVASFAIDPFNNNKLYAGIGASRGTTRGGIYVSNDAGLTWSQLGSTATDTVNFRRFRTLKAIAPDPFRQGVIISGSRDKGIWRSTNAGATWTNVFSAPLAPATNNSVAAGLDDLNPNRAPISIVLFHPTDSNIVFAGADGYGILKSTDAGVTWSTINSGLLNTVWVKYLSINSTGNILYAACGEDGVYKTADGGLNWTHASQGIPTTNDDWVSSVVVHPTKPDTAYFTAATSNASTVWKTTNGGASWSQSLTFNFDEINNPTQSWHQNTTVIGASRAWHIDMDPFNPERLMYTELWTMFKSDDGAATWNEKVVGAQNTCVMDLFVDRNHPTNEPDTIWAAHMDAGLMRSYNQGNSWEMMSPSANLTGANLDAVKGHYPSIRIVVDGGTKYFYTIVQSSTITGSSTVLRSTDGVSWQMVLNVNDDLGGIWNNGKLMFLGTDPSSTSIVYALQDGGNIYKSTSNGDMGTWNSVSQAGDGSYSSIAIDNNGTIFISTMNDGIWRSTNGGNNWTQVLLPATKLIYKVKTNGSQIYATGVSSTAGESAQYKSTDGGTTWNIIQSLKPSGNEEHGGRTMAIDPTDSKHIVYILQNHFSVVDANSLGVFESFDNGVTWNLKNDNLPNSNIVTLDFGLDGTLYAGVRCGSGIWKLPADSVVGIKDVGSGNSLYIYPNPAKDYVVVEFNNPTQESYTLKLYDVQGRTVKRITNITANQITITTEHLNSGLYFFHLYGTKNNIDNTGKLVVE